MHVGAFAHGWLGWLSAEKIGSMAQWMAKADYPLRIGTLVLELGALLFFARAATAKTLLMLWTILLGAFFACFGYFFWKWILVQLTLLWLLKQWEEDASRQSRLFHWKAFLCSLPIIGGASITFQSAGLAWFDTPLAHGFHYEAIGESGDRYTIPTRLLAPYHEEFTMAHFGYLSTSKTLVSPYGATINREIANRLTEAQSAEEAVEIVEELGHDGFSSELKSNLVTLLKKWLQQQNVQAANGTGFEWRRPLPFLWSFREPEVYQHQEPLVRLYISRKTQFFDGEEIHELVDSPLAEIEAKPNW